MVINRQSMSGNFSASMIIFGVLIVIGVTFYLVFLPMLLRPEIDLKLGDGVFRTKVALNDSERTKGLSGVNKLNPDQALLMAYPRSDKWGIWMKDMNFPIDIVWLDINKKVIFIVKNAPSNESTTLVYKPITLAKYVVELPAGTVESKSVMIKDVATFQIDYEKIR